MDTEIKLTEEQKREVDYINSMSHLEMCTLWRLAPPGHSYFDKTSPYCKAFEDRLYKHFGGFTSNISKILGWQK